MRAANFIRSVEHLADGGADRADRAWSAGVMLNAGCALHQRFLKGPRAAFHLRGRVLRS